MKDSIVSTINNLKNNGFKVEYYQDSNTAKKAIVSSIQVDDTIGIGGSMTIFDMGIYEELLEKNAKVYWHWKVADSYKDSVRKEASIASIYLTSTNAITEDGFLVNMDGVGNRVASMFYGHEKVYVVAGTNKICKDYEAALDRIRNVAAPKNAKRLNLETPCVKGGKCLDCKALSRICNVEVILRRAPSGGDITIFLIDEELGY